MRIVRKKTLDDGRIEEFFPMKNKNGQYILADRAVDPQHNKAVNQFFVESEEALVARIRMGGISVRMLGSISKQPNLISATEIEIIPETEAEAESDPFEVFGEWASAEDENAYRSL